MLENTLNSIIEAHRCGDWLSVMYLNNASDSNLLLWPKPEVEDLKFIRENLKLFEIHKVTSIGAGTGLLEWLLNIVAGIEVISIEIDKSYWSNRNSRHNFCTHIFPGNKLFNEYVCSAEYALLFCYFNNADAFQEYLMNYKGNVLIIIGPGVIGKYTKPMPYDKNIPLNWKLQNKRIMNGEDIIAIYKKTTKSFL